MSAGMRIGKLAARFGLNPRTIRYYEEIGLLRRADRSESGYRCYDQQDVKRLRFILRAKALGLSLEEIRDLLATWQKGSPPCGHVLNLIDQKIQIIDQRVAELQAFRTELITLRSRWADPDTSALHGEAAGGICPIVEQQIEVQDRSQAMALFDPVSRR